MESGIQEIVVYRRGTPKRFCVSARYMVRHSGSHQLAVDFGGVVYTIAMRTRDRIRALRLRAAEVLEDEKAAQRWMKSEIVALGLKRPIDVAKTAEGYELCCTILGRLEHGVYS